jgi:hypothetical protein
MRNVVVIPPKAISIAGASSLRRTECDGSQRRFDPQRGGWQMKSHQNFT